MPRPADTYTHAQFELVTPDGDTVRCVHCEQWTGPLKTLNRKKDHLLKCSRYLTWRAGGNGQDLTPTNKYSKRNGSALDDSTYSYNDIGYPDQPANPNVTPVLRVLSCKHMDRPNTVWRIHLPRPATDVAKAYEELWNDDSTQRCVRVRCKHCGAVRAKNVTRQYEHLQTCRDFLNSTEGSGIRANAPTQPMTSSDDNPKGIWRGSAPNPNLLSQPSRINQTPQQRPPPQPSLVVLLLTRHKDISSEASNQPFLQHAGAGTVPRAALQQWLCQQGHILRALATFIGSCIGKIRLSETKNPQADTLHRAFDLLRSALNNASRELDFLRNTQVNFGLMGESEPPRTATRGLVDLFASSASPSASLLEALVVLWAVEHLYQASWHYAAFYRPSMQSSTSYLLPAYLQPSPLGASTSAATQTPTKQPPDSRHAAALHEALIPNWTSTGFIQFVGACGAIVDEVANTQTTGSGAAELSSCESAFRQVCWLWKQIWPDHVDGKKAAAPGGGGGTSSNAANGHATGTTSTNVIDVEDGTQNGEHNSDDEGEGEADAKSNDSLFEATPAATRAAATGVRA